MFRDIHETNAFWEAVRLALAGPTAAVVALTRPHRAHHGPAQLRLGDGAARHVAVSVDEAGSGSGGPIAHAALVDRARFTVCVVVAVRAAGLVAS